MESAINQHFLYLLSCSLQFETSWHWVYEAVTQQSEYCPGHSKSRCVNKEGSLEAEEKSKSVICVECWDFRDYLHDHIVICPALGDGGDREQWNQDISTSRLWQWWGWRLQGAGMLTNAYTLYSWSAGYHIIII